MRPVEPGLEVTENLMHVGESLVGPLGRADDPHVVNELGQSCLGVARPAIRSNAAAGLDVASQEGTQAVLACVSNQSQSKPAGPFPALAILVLVDQYLNACDDQAFIPSPASSAAPPTYWSSSGKQNRPATDTESGIPDMLHRSKTSDETPAYPWDTLVYPHQNSAKIMMVCQQ